MGKRSLIEGGLWAAVGLGGSAVITNLTVTGLPPVLSGALLFGGVAAVCLSLGALSAMFLAHDKWGPLGRRNTTVSAAIGYAASRNWGTTTYDATISGAEMAPIVRALEQASHDKELRIWGQRRREGPFELIEPDFWLSNQIEWFSLLRGDAHTEPLNNATGRAVYEHLMVSRAEIERLWPRARRRLSIRFARAA